MSDYQILENVYPTTLLHKPSGSQHVLTLNECALVKYIFSLDAKISDLENKLYKLSRDMEGVKNEKNSDN